MGLIRNLAAGAVAGAVGTAAMDALLYSRYRGGGGKESFFRWEFAGDVIGWDQASAPGQVGMKALGAVTGQDPPNGWARATTNIVHWATGIGWTIQYAALGPVTARHPWARALALGPVVWLSGYAILPLLQVYKPIWEYDARTLAEDLSAHLVFGTVTSATFALLTRAGRAPRHAI